MPQHERRRPAPTSALAPSPAPLMPVPDPPRPRQPEPPAGRGPAAGDPERGPGHANERAGRRQHHRPGAPPEPDAEKLVFLSGRIPRPLRDELHIRAIHEGRPAVDLLRDALRRYLDDPPERTS